MLPAIVPARPAAVPRARRVLLLGVDRVRELLLHGDPVGGRTHEVQERRQSQGRGQSAHV